jgi:antitoxin MazE
MTIPYAEEVAMRTRIVKMGKSYGIRIPKPLLEATGLEGEVDVSIKHNCLVIKSRTKARAGWAAQFREMARRGDDALIDGSAFPATRWDEEEWQ